MRVPTALYNFPSTALLGLLAGLAIICIAGVALWQSGKADLQFRLKKVLAAVGFALIGVITTTTSAYLALVQIDFEEKATPFTGAALPHVSAVAIWAQTVVLFALFAVLIFAILGHKPINIAGSAVLLAVALANYADLCEFKVFKDAWALGITAGWFLVAATTIAFLATLATVKIRSYGLRQFELGRMAGVDMAQKVTA